MMNTVFFHNIVGSSYIRHNLQKVGRKWITNLIKTKNVYHKDTVNKFPGNSDGKASAYNAGDPGSIPGSERSLGEGNGDPLQ